LRHHIDDSVILLVDVSNWVLARDQGGRDRSGKIKVTRSVSPLRAILIVGTTQELSTCASIRSEHRLANGSALCHQVDDKMISGIVSPKRKRLYRRAVPSS